MSLVEKINTDIKQAMKEKNQTKLTALRAVKSELLLLSTSGSDTPITEEVELKLLQRLSKQRKDSAELYMKNGRDDLYQKEIDELGFIVPYLPQPMSEEELTTVLKSIIEQVGASSPKDMGKVMGIASKELLGKADGKIIAEKVKSLLA